ncbi:hypothetical protein [Desulfosporosinus metallidurans]|uniref:hypothetical protein n=1 Tax=Desulfosporosinus metallidurans TaxID=1888891 RepID=UPI00094DE192|nr:hypothetical protein [Desulfosporosinus metallidurans]
MDSSQLTNIIAIVSAAIALIAVIIYGIQARFARKSYVLQKAIYETGSANLIVKEIYDSFLYNEYGLDRIYFFLKITVLNLSDKANSLTNAQLQIVYNDNRYIMQYSNDISIYPELARLEIPVNISSHNSHSGWIVFELPKKTYDSIDIDTHYIVVNDIHGSVAKKEEIYIREEIVGYEF